MLKVIPPQQGDAWISVAEMNESQQAKFIEISKTFINHIGAVASNADSKVTGSELDKAVKDFEEMARANNAELYDHAGKINAEVHYNDFHPFRWAYSFYFLAFITFLLVWTLSKESLTKFAWVFLALGFAFHTYGFGVRMYIMGRPPVSNMYETVVWVAWGSVLFATILEVIYKFRVILVAGTLGAAFCLVIADFAPAILDPLLTTLRACFAQQLLADDPCDDNHYQLRRVFLGLRFG